MSRNNLFLFLSFLFFLPACSNTQTTKDTQQAPKTEKTPDVPIVGGDSDEHGCKGSAGYSWSVVKNECIRIFSDGVRLDPKAADLDKTLSAFVVFKSDTDDAQAELFIPNVAKSVILTKEKKESAGTWKNANYVLTQWKGMYSLEDSHKKLLYQGAVSKN